MVVEVPDMHDVSSGLASCWRWNAHGSGLHMLYLHCSHAASLAWAAWSSQSRHWFFCIRHLMYTFKMLESSTVCYEAIAACKSSSYTSYTSAPQKACCHIFALLMHIQTQSQDFWLSFKQCEPYLVSDHHTCLGLQSSRVSTIFQITYSWEDRLMSHRLSFKKHSARLHFK